ncbi:heme-dependent oxidative N-demethylase subunit alpha family protein [Ramlibacter sp. PS3R-8]|uniref:heme-dependent oxidative N-demethylase subunit alpha family protein n=1 Tax=Ramlibacter sp. PS3R-8 TaxID=3133437 RepID=UPI0030A665AB
MSFDLAHAAVPFRMQPGLQRLDSGARHLTPLAPGSPLWQEKNRVVASGASRLAVPGFDPQAPISAILARARSEGFAAHDPIELAFEEDFALLDGASTTLPWLCVSVPSHWAPEDKLGLAFHSVHAPVADNHALVAAGRQLVQLVTGGGHFERFVWTLTPSGRYDQHPRRHGREPWPATAEPVGFAGQCWLRSERQTFFPVPGVPGQAIFTIRVMLQPLPDAVRSADDARRLHDSLASMSDAVLEYKGLAPARERLLAWLAHRGA